MAYLWLISHEYSTEATIGVSVQINPQFIYWLYVRDIMKLQQFFHNYMVGQKCQSQLVHYRSNDDSINIQFLSHKFKCNWICCIFTHTIIELSPYTQTILHSTELNIKLFFFTDLIAQFWLDTSCPFPLDDFWNQ